MSVETIIITFHKKKNKTKDRESHIFHIRITHQRNNPQSARNDE